MHVVGNPDLARFGLTDDARLPPSSIDRGSVQTIMRKKQVTVAGFVFKNLETFRSHPEDRRGWRSRLSMPVSPNHINHRLRSL